MSMCQIKTKTVHWYSFIYHFLWTAKVHVLYINVHITIVWVGERGCKIKTPHSLCINAAQLAQYCPLQQHRQTQISPSTSISYNFGDRHLFFLGNTMFRESERSANIMATTEHSIHPNLNIPKNVALGS